MMNYLAHQYWVIRLKGEDLYVGTAPGMVGPMSLPLQGPSDDYPPRLFHSEKKAKAFLTTYIRHGGNKRSTDDLEGYKYEDFEILPAVLGVREDGDV